MLTKKLDSKHQCQDLIYAILVARIFYAVTPNNAKRNKATAFESNAPFINCISKTNGVKIDNTEDCCNANV